MDLSPNHRRAHWDDRYRTIGAASVSWYEHEPTMSLDLIDRVATTTATSIIDVGGGASTLTSVLQRGGFVDLTVLDISQTALDEARLAVDRPDAVTWIRADLLTWSPDRRWAVWHDRAVFHFLTNSADRAIYRELLHRAVEPGGTVMIATFAEDGPTTCSGLPVSRYDPAGLLNEIGSDWKELDCGRTEHLTPTGATQPFTWVMARKTTV